MSDYCGLSRSSYFRIVDELKWEIFCKIWNLDPIDNSKTGTDKKVGFVVKDGGIPDWAEVEISGDCDSCNNDCSFCPCRDCTKECGGCNAKENGVWEFDRDDFISQLSTLLTSESVAIVMEIGYEKLRYLYGFAIAINNRGFIRTISLNEIYDIAVDLTDKPEEITRAEY
jgi:hypothetical protein